MGTQGKIKGGSGSGARGSRQTAFESDGVAGAASRSFCSAAEREARRCDALHCSRGRHARLRTHHPAAREQNTKKPPAADPDHPPPPCLRPPAPSPQALRTKQRASSRRRRRAKIERRTGALALNRARRRQFDETIGAAAAARSDGKPARTPLVGGLGVADALEALLHLVAGGLAWHAQATRSE